MEFYLQGSDRKCGYGLRIKNCTTGNDNEKLVVSSEDPVEKVSGTEETSNYSLSFQIVKEPNGIPFMHF